MDAYQQLLNLQNATFSLIDHEDAMVAIVYKVIQPNGAKLILKIHKTKNDYLREIYFLRLFANKIPVPRIVNVVPPGKDIHGAILMECLPGELLKANEMTESLAHELGRCFALIHLNRLPGYGDPIQDNLSDDPREYFTFKFKESLDECKSHLPLHLVEACQSYYDTHVHLLSAVDGPCTVHRDFRPGNLMVHHGQLQGIIDWAGARASFAEEDFCSLEHGNWLHQHKTTFLSGYADIRPLPKYSYLISFLRINNSIATIGFMVKRGIWETSGKRIYQFNRQFLENVFMKD